MARQAILAPISRVCFGSYHALALGEDGSIWAWGSNRHGQLGVEGVETSSAPVRVPGSAEWIHAAAEGETSLAVRSDGTLWMWGKDSGLGDGQDAWSPAIANKDAGWREVSLSGGVLLGLKDDGSLWEWDFNLFSGGTSRHEPKPRAPEKAWSRAETDGLHTILLARDGTLWTEGISWWGGSGDPLDGVFRVQVGTDMDWTALARSESHIVLLKQDGSLWSFGGNRGGELGVGDRRVRREPVQVGFDRTWTSIASSHERTLGVKQDGSLWAWGVGPSGQLGLVDGRSHERPRRVGAESAWKSVFCGESATAAVRDDGTVWIWGEPPAGPDEMTAISSRSPTRTLGQHRWASFSLNAGSLLAIERDGSLWAWGRNDNWQLGLDRWCDRYAPECVCPDRDWAGVHAGTDLSLALKRDGSLWAWGVGKPQPAIGPTVRRPRLIADGGPWAGFAGDRYIVATDGRLWKWNPATGLTWDGRPMRWSKVSRRDSESLGTGIARSGALCVWLPASQSALDLYDLVGVLSPWEDLLESPAGSESDEEPIRLGGSADWQSSAAGFAHILGLRHDGTMWSMGGNNHGQLGLGHTTNASVLTQIGSRSDWVGVAAAQDHSLALAEDGSLWSWGLSICGQPGALDESAVAAPQRVGEDEDWAGIAASGASCAGLKRNGSIWVWGWDRRGLPGASGASFDAEPHRLA